MGLIASALLDLLDGGDDALAMGLMGVAAIAVAAALLKTRRLNHHPRTGQSLTILLLVWVTAIGIGTAVYLVTGTFSGRGFWSAFSDSLFESASGFTTTGMTALPVVEEASRGVLAFRAISNWLGGLGGLTVAVAVLPFLTGTHSLSSDPDRTHGALRSIAPSSRRAMRNILAIYGGFSALLVVAYAATGIGVFNAFAYGLSTASTGGFATNTNSLWGENNAGAEWVAIFGMFVAGTNLAVLWWGIRGAANSVWKSQELRLYVFATTIGVVVTSIAVAANDGALISRQAVFAVASTISTTGLRAHDWEAWHPGATTLLFVFMAIGSMSGSAGGGFRWLRIRTLLAFIRRDLLSRLYPKSVLVVKIDGRPIAESVVQQLVGYLVLYAGFVLAGAYAVALFEDGFRRALIAALSAVSTTGALVGVPSAEQLRVGERAVLVPLMIAGRLAILPVVVSAIRLLDRIAARTRSTLAGRGYTETVPGGRRA